MGLSVCVYVLVLLECFICDKINTTYMYLTGDADHRICGNFAISASFKSDGVICLPTASYSDIAAVLCTTFRRQSLLKLLKRLTVVQMLPGIRLNVTQRV